MARPRKPIVRSKLPEHVHRTVARGHEYFTYQKGRNTKTAGERKKLPHPSDPGFWDAYRALSGMEAPKPADGTFAALTAAYRASDEWNKDLAESTKVDWLRYLQRIENTWGPLWVADLEPKHVALRDKFGDTPAAANNLLRCLSAMISWSVLRGWRSDNPCLIVPKLNRSVPYARWPWTAIETVREHAPRELWWAAALALYSGQRQGDVLRMKWSDVRDNVMSVLQEKTGTHVSRCGPGHDPEAVDLHSDKLERSALEQGRFPHLVGPDDGAAEIAGGSGLPRPEEERRGDVARSWLHGRRGERDHRTVAQDGRALRTAGEQEATSGERNPQVGEREVNWVCTTGPKTLYNGSAATVTTC